MKLFRTTFFEESLEMFALLVYGVNKKSCRESLNKKQCLMIISDLQSNDCFFVTVAER